MAIKIANSALCKIFYVSRANTADDVVTNIIIDKIIWRTFACFVRSI